MTDDASRRGVPILAYHSLDDSGSVISTSPAVFRQQMRWLHDAGFQAMSLGQYVNTGKGADYLPSRTVVVTFDDGFKNVGQQAEPILREFGFSATIFVVAGRCGMDNGWEGQPTTIPRFPLLDWNELGALADRGLEIGAHTLTHPSLAHCEPERALLEIVDSQRVLQTRLGKPVASFAYPYGAATPSQRKIVAEQFAAACGTRLAVAQPLDDLHWLPRIEMFYFRSLPIFRGLLSPAGPGYLRLRNIGRRGGQLFRNCRQWLTR